MELTIQLASSARLLKGRTEKDIEDYKGQSSITQTKKRGGLVETLPAFPKSFSIFGDQIINLFNEDKIWKHKLGNCNGKWMVGTKVKHIKGRDDKKSFLKN